MPEFHVCPHVTTTYSSNTPDFIIAQADAVKRLPDASLVHLVQCGALGHDMRQACLTSLSEKWDETGQDTDGERDRIVRLIKEGRL